MLRFRATVHDSKALDPKHESRSRSCVNSLEPCFCFCVDMPGTSGAEPKAGLHGLHCSCNIFQSPFHEEPELKFRTVLVGGGLPCEQMRHTVQVTAQIQHGWTWQDCILDNWQSKHALRGPIPQPKFISKSHLCKPTVRIPINV